MILWVIALLTVAAVAVVGYYQGALRVALSLIGLFIAASLATPIGALLQPLLSSVGIKNPLTAAFLAPVLVFVVVMTVVKVIAHTLHKKVETWYKYRGSDTERMLWERMNTRVGVPLGAANGVVYVFLICTLVHALGYFTVQVETSDKDSWALRTVNSLTKSLQKTGMDKATARFMPKSEFYYDSADVVADIFQTPLLQNRLANYPPLLLMGEKSEFKPLSDEVFQKEWINGMTFGTFVNHEKVKPLVQDRSVLTNVLGILGGDLKDLKTYLQSGESPKYDEEVILGRWAFDYNKSRKTARRKNPTMGTRERKRLAAILTTIYKDATLVATVDKDAILKLPAGVAGTSELRGVWKPGEIGKYVLVITDGGQKKELEVTIKGRDLIFTRGGILLVFRNTRV